MRLTLDFYYRVTSNTTSTNYSVVGLCKHAFKGVAMTPSPRWPFFFVVLVGILFWSPDRVSGGPGYNQVNLVSDLPAVAPVLDLKLVNPWGMASSAASPLWVSDNLTGLATLYNGAGAVQALVVTIPSTGTPPSGPTGVVFNGTTDFAIAPDVSPALFIFTTLDGTISGWRTGTSAVIAVQSPGSVYTGLALGNNGTENFLYAANISAGRVDVFDRFFSPRSLTGTFTDPTLPAGFAPFGIQNIGGVLFVTYARQDLAPVPGSGFVDEFDMNGNFVKRLLSQGALNSPWGLAMAPGNFGDLSGDLLVSNFGDGKINGFDPTTGAFLGTLSDGAGNPIVVPGLRGLRFGNGGSGGLPNELFFTAGIPGPDNIGDHGLFGKFGAIPPPTNTPTVTPTNTPTSTPTNTPVPAQVPAVPTLTDPAMLIFGLLIAAAGLLLLVLRR